MGGRKPSFILDTPVMMKVWRTVPKQSNVARITQCESSWNVVGYQGASSEYARIVKIRRCLTKPVAVSVTSELVVLSPISPTHGSLIPPSQNKNLPLHASKDNGRALSLRM